MLQSCTQIPFDEFPNRVMANPVVSVCLLTYNHKPFIRRSIESIISQKCSYSLEICIGDDDSNDGTREICMEYAKSHPKLIRLILGKRIDVIKVNGKATAAANLKRLLSIAQGKYIALLEGDDYWIHDTKLQQQVDFLETHSDFSFSGHLVGYTKSPGCGFPANVNFSNGIGILTKDDFLNGSYCHTSTLIFRRPIDKEPEQMYSLIAQDYFLQLWLSCYGSCAVFPFVGSVYHYSGHGLWSSMGIWGQIKSERSFRKFFHDAFPSMSTQLTAHFRNTDIFYIKCIAKIPLRKILMFIFALLRKARFL